MRPAKEEYGAWMTTRRMVIEEGINNLNKTANDAVSAWCASGQLRRSMISSRTYTTRTKSISRNGGSARQSTRSIMWRKWALIIYSSHCSIRRVYSYDIETLISTLQNMIQTSDAKTVSPSIVSLFTHTLMTFSTKDRAGVPHVRGLCALIVYGKLDQKHQRLTPCVDHDINTRCKGSRFAS